ncbi:hypothetical protein AB4851_21595 [Burkholderia sp. 22PA0099]|uniref:hypothetical protein n=1 Tax=Burkholderia sp. 22PA0099 TaxID=3237372 RepID=UPI0039C2C114
MSKMSSMYCDSGKRQWWAVLLIAIASWGSNANAKQPTKQEERPPVVLDTQTGIHDGRSGTVLQTAPLNPAPIVEPAQIRQPAELQQNNQVPVVVAPYIRLPATPGYRQ